MRWGIVITLLIELLTPADGCAGEIRQLDEQACRVAFAARPHPSVLRADFTQEKTLPEVTKPLRTQGELLVSASDGVLLRTLQPAFAQGSRFLPLPRPDQKSGNIESRIGRLIQSVLAGDFSPLSDVFSATGEADGPRLTITLTPKSVQVKEVISRLTLRFDSHLEEVVVEEATGGRIRMTFSGFRAGPPPTAEELQGFASAR